MNDQDHRRAARGNSGAAIAVALFLVSVLYLTVSMDRTVNPYDESIMLFGADRVLHGDVPHRDFYALYGPGQFYVIAGLFKLFGVSVWIERVWNTIAAAGAVGLIFLVVNRVAPRGFAVLAALAGLPWFQNDSIYGTSVIPCMTGILAGLVFLAPALGRIGAAARLLGAGLCAGVVALFRYDVGVTVFGVECALVAISIWFERRTEPHYWRSVTLSLAMFGAGFAIVTVPVVIAYAMTGVLPDLYFDVITFPARNYARTRSLPLPRLGTLWSNTSGFAGVYLPLILCAAAVPAIVAARSGRQSALRWTLLALVALDLVWFAKGYVRASTLQMAMALVLCAPLAVVLTQPLLGRGRLYTTFGGAALAGFIWFTIASERPAIARIERNLSQPPDCRVAPGLDRFACFDLSADDARTAQYIQQHTAPDDAVFVGVARHDRIFVNTIALYFAIGRPAATKWHHFDPGLQTSAPIQRDIVGELTRGHTKFLVIDSRWEGIHESNESALSSGVTILDDFIRRTYQPVATFGPNTIMLLNTS